ncbi:hypothetical protein GLOTRDRAFT_102290 [Gloeophyllum trabeum ATCC 11539]|uniref:Uncharacterized protein n=1 Tax=Gloeophyllum trabeum (strain ATCC 11539 / FP-39264 / Madison 617) TaxID=670483 RepID=S7QM57_GLOTA|nr:uncharacterized protein GLOTRDRAFT_102290 [Gloeophyllum trabeum ATCC 11539]EPQ60538.1 hypothetical protein GLOTRDRAFT_102290 [Gloeophyllum trabeum ATCC 11539]
MFDEFVEHAAAPNGGLGHGASALPQVQYEGFEPSPYERDDFREEFEEAALGEETDPAAAAGPVFELGRVQYTLPAPLVSMAVSSDVLAMALASNTIVLIALAHADQVMKIQIPRKTNEMSVSKIFMDPSGRHIIVTSPQGENWYLYRTWKKPRQLKGFKMVIESIAWNKAALLSSHSTSTREMLIGARNGTIYEAVLDAEEDFFKSQERYLQSLFSLPERHPVTGIKFDLFPASDPRRALVIVTTPSRIYQFVGVPDRRTEEGGRIFSNLFASYRDVAPTIFEIPGGLDHSELHVYTPDAEQVLSLPKTMAWMASLGIYHGTLNFESTSDNLIDNAQMLPYPSLSGLSPQEWPKSIALTEFHFLLLYKDRVAAICNLDEKLSYEEMLPLKPNEEVKGLAADPVRKTYWVYTDQSLFELVVGNEDRDVWKVYLERGQYDLSLRYAKTARQRDRVLSAHANALFNEGRYFQAAQAYSQCSASFEEVTLRFLDAGERDALRAYLISRLEKTRKGELTQRMILATWLVEFYLSKCNELDDVVASESVSHDVENLETERKIVEEDLKNFFVTYKANLDPQTVYDLIQGHGRTDMYIYYATTIGDYDRVIEHWILEEEWIKAIDVLNRQTDLELYYRFSPVLVRHAPKDTVESWLRQPALEPLRLVPALLRLQHLPRDPLVGNQAIRYLNHVIFEQQNTSSIIHNLLITFYAAPSPSLQPSPDEDGPLLKFLSNAPTDPMTGKPYYDLDYALRLCKQANRIQPCVHIYSKMGLWENSVDLALAKGDLELAQINADMPDNDLQLRKKLWLKIAKAMRFLENTDLLKVEDILPFFPDFVVIDDFKDEICNALEGYAAHIETLKGEMDEATRNAEAIKQDIAALRNRFVTLDAGECCSTCGQLLFTRQFYVFPCQHTFHADCLIGLAKEYLPAHALRRILALQNELMKNTQKSVDRSTITTPTVVSPGGQGPRQPLSQRTLLSANFTNLTNPLQNGTRTANAIGRNLLSAGDRLRDLIVPDALASVVSAPGWIPGMGGKKTETEKDGGKKTEKLRAELDEVLASSCPLCESVVVGLDKPFVKEGEMDSSWEL